MKLSYKVFFSKANNGYFSHTFESVYAVIMNFGLVALLMFVPVAGIALACFFMGYLCLCYKGYYVNLLQNKKVGLEDYFINLSYSLKAFILKFSTMLISALWALVFIVPGIIAALNYSMSFYIMADDKTKDVNTCMQQSKALVQGARGEIFIIYLSEIFVTTLVASLFTALTLALKTYLTLALWFTIALPIALSLFVLVVLIIPYYEMMLSNLYLTLKEEKQPKPKSQPQPKRTPKDKPLDLINN